MEPSHSLCFTSFLFPHLTLKEHSTALHLVQVITNSIKVTNKTIFTHDCLISGHYKWRLRFERSDSFLSVILDEVLMCVLSHRLGTVKTAACDAAHVCTVMMNGCLVCRFYGVLVVHFTVAGGPAEWDVSWRGQTEVMYSYRRSHSLPVILPIWGHQRAIKNH